MPNYFINKEAAARAKSLRHLRKILHDSQKTFQAGGPSRAAQQYYNAGTSGSMFFDMATKLPKKLLRFGGQKQQYASRLKDKKPLVRKVNTVGDKITDGIMNFRERYQRRLADADIKAGNFIADKLKDTKAKNLFVNKHTFKTKSPGGVPDALLEVEIPSLTAPINKAKKVAIPMAGTFTIAGQMDKALNKKKNEGGEAMKQARHSRDELIEKIAKTLSAEDAKTQVVITSDKQREICQKLAKLANEAVTMLKVASSDKQILVEENEKLAAENKKLQLQIMAKNRSSRAVKLASEMKEKGLIKKAEVQNKVDEIMEMDDESYKVLSDTVGKISKHANVDEGIDSLAYISIEEGKAKRVPKSLADEIDSLANSFTR